MPILLANVCWMMVGVVDVIMLGHWDSELVAVAMLAGVWVHLTQMLGMGLVMGIDPLVTQAHGARDRVALGRALQRGVIIAVAAAVPVIALRFFTAEFLAATRVFASWIVDLGQASGDAASALELHRAAELDDAAESYALAQSFAEPAFFVYIAVRQSLQGRGILRPGLVVAAVANVVNVAGNWLLIYELEQGIVGAGIATGVTRAFMCVAIVWVHRSARLGRGAWVPWDRESFNLRANLAVVRVGFPVALHFVFEMGAFGASTLLAGFLGVTATIAHGVAINMASLTFMVPLGIGLAATTRVGNLIGERRYDDAQHSAYVALGIGAATMAALGVVLFAGRHVFPRAYVPDDPAALRLVASILPIAAAFQVFDGLQVVSAGILRGMGRTTPAAVFNFLAWWILALPVGAYLVLRRNGTLAEVWWSLVLGLSIVAVLGVVYIHFRGPRRLAPPTST